MFDDIAIRAVFIGASILVILFVFSLVTIYYNQAKDLTSATSLMPIDTFYVAEIENSLKEFKNDNKLLNGSQLKNMVNYYYESEKVEIFVDSVKFINGETSKIKEGFDLNGYKFAEKGIDESLYKKINYYIDPDSRYNLITKESNNFITYTFSLKEE